MRMLLTICLALTACLTLAALAPRVAAQPEPSEQQLRRAVQLASSALADLEADNYGRAESALREVSSILPDNLLPPVNLAICYFRLNRPADALSQLRRARELDPDNLQALYTLARILENEIEVDAAAFETWNSTIEAMIRVAPRDARPHYLRGRSLAQRRLFEQAGQSQRRALERSPENLVLMIDSLVSAAQAGSIEATSDALDATEDRLNGFDGRVEEFAQRLRDALFEQNAAALGRPALLIQNLLRPTELYQLGLVELEGREGGNQLFPQLEFDPPLPKSIQGGQDIEISFRDDTGAAKLADLEGIQQLLIEHRATVEDLLVVATGSETERVRLDGTERLSRTPLDDPEGPRGPTIAYDVDQDGLTDRVAAGPGELILHRGNSDGGYQPGESIGSWVPPQGSAVRALFPLDVDHDGDLDLFVARSGAQDLYFQNNGGGGFEERAKDLGIDGGRQDTSALVSADFDLDGDLDLVVSYTNRPLRFFTNRRSGPLIDGTQQQRLGDSAGADQVATADFDSDGRFDLIVWKRGQPLRLLRNTTAGFESWLLPSEADEIDAAATGDFDNDGDTDIAIARAGGVLLLRCVRQEQGLPHWKVEPIEVSLGGVRSLTAGDFDRDGDLDLAAHTDAGALRFLRNQGGNANQWLRLGLLGLNDNNAKNNTQGLYVLIEVRTGGSYQAFLGSGGVNHIGLGARRQADVIRVVWTNGLSQTWQQVGSGQVLTEKQVLKGSCPLLYTFDGAGFSFVTDLMWRSTLGMIFSDGTAAPHQSARDWVLIPGERLAPIDDELWLQVTDELWEAIYLDKQSLLVVDTPPGLRPVVDESFRRPPHPTEPPLHLFGDLLPPARAFDHLDREVLGRIASVDGLYVDQLPLTRYQGVTTGHSLTLSFDDVPEGEPLQLVLWGWIFPSDTTINFALSQDPTLETAPPRLEWMTADGHWRELSPSIGLPMGKNKAMVIDLGSSSQLVRGGQLHLRLSTQMQIYWDAAALAVGPSTARPDRRQARIQRLEPRRAHLHYRGFSRLYRDSPSGPHLFDYQRVDIRPRFRTMAGRYTRYGEVSDLVLQEDDRYVVMSPGDELSLVYSTQDLAPPPRGWRRDYILYTDGWVKDADLHTTASDTLEPWPYHGMSSYPDRPEHAAPEDEAFREFLAHYQTRVLDDTEFVTLLRNEAGEQ